LLRSLPVPQPQQLAVLTDPDEHGAHFGSQTGGRSLLAYSEFEYLRDHNQVFSQMFAADSNLPELEVTIAGSSHYGQKETARVGLASGDYFNTLEMKPAAVKLFTSEVDRARGASPIAIISYAFWKQRFGLNPAALGQNIQIHNTAFEIVGVTRCASRRSLVFCPRAVHPRSILRSLCATSEWISRSAARDVLRISYFISSLTSL
jgi:MacB-like periplasmic core domain